MALILVDPFAEVVVFGKAYPVAWPPPGATSVKALLPTGRHVSHANALLHVRNSRGGGGKATRLEHYTGKKSGGRATSLVHVKKGVSEDPFEKGLVRNFKAGFDPALRGPGKGVAGRLGTKYRSVSDKWNAPRQGASREAKYEMQARASRGHGPVEFLGKSLRNTSPHSAIPTASKSGRRLG
jgi:hypothetical protein